MSEAYGMKREKPKRGKQTMSHAQLIALETIRNCERLSFSLKEITGINRSELNKLPGSHLAELARVIKDAHRHLCDAKEGVLPFLI